MHNFQGWKNRVAGREEGEESQIWESLGVTQSHGAGQLSTSRTSSLLGLAFGKTSLRLGSQPVPHHSY